MTVTKRAKAVADQVIGTAKETVGKLTGRRSIKNKGTVQRLKGQASETGHKVTGAAKANIEKAKGVAAKTKSNAKSKLKRAS